MESHPSYDYDFDPEAPNDTAAAVYRLAREGGPRVLDLGSGPAVVSSRLKEYDSKQVTCVDTDPDRLATARTRGVEDVVEADLDDEHWANGLVNQEFDVIILADVLEHLRRPHLPLQLIRQRRLLADGGFLVISIPNAAHEAVVAALLARRWGYRETGLLDATHLRFFTRESFVDLLEREGFSATRWHRRRVPLERTEMADLVRDLPEGLRSHLAQLEEGDTYQFIVRAEPSDHAAELSRLRDELAAAAEERERLKAALSALREEQRQVAAQQRDEDEQRREHVQRLRDERDALKQKLQSVYASRTWKIGRIVTGAARGMAHPKTTLARRRTRARGATQATTTASAASESASARRMTESPPAFPT